MDLDLLRAFVATAEEGTVARAAQRLHISQSPLSRQIIRLEQDLGLTLFERVRKRLRLTPEGHRFLVEARGLLEQAAAVRAAARRLAQGEEAPLAIGYVQAAVQGGLLAAALRRLDPVPPLRLQGLRTAPLQDAVLAGRLDLGLGHRPHEALANQLLCEEEFLLALPDDHPLATGPLEAAALDGQPWISLDRSINPGFQDQFLAACAGLGFRPDIRHQTADPAAALGLVAAGLGLAMVHEGLARWGLPARVVLRALPAFPLRVRLYALWRPDNPSAGVGRLLDALRPPAGQSALPTRSPR